MSRYKASTARVLTTRSTPESVFPLRVRRSTVVPDSGNSSM